MKNAVILHGWPDEKSYFDPAQPSSSNNHWFPWLQKQLIIKGINAQTPEMPEAYLPVYEKWKSVFEQFVVSKETILIGHSCGAGFLIRWLSENKVNVGKVILVASWLDPEKEMENGFFEFVIDKGLVERTGGVSVLYSTDDEDVMTQTVNILKNELPEINFVEFKDKGHFCLDDLGTQEFPEILQELNL